MRDETLQHPNCVYQIMRRHYARYTPRGEIEVKALVTDRLRPFVIQGRTVYQIGMPWLYGWKGYARGAVANVLLAITGDPNVTIHSTKALSCGMRKKGVPPA